MAPACIKQHPTADVSRHCPCTTGSAQQLSGRHRPGLALQNLLLQHCPHLLHVLLLRHQCQILRTKRSHLLRVLPVLVLRHGAAGGRGAVSMRDEGPSGLKGLAVVALAGESVLL